MLDFTNPHQETVYIRGLDGDNKGLGVIRSEGYCWEYANSRIRIFNLEVLATILHNNHPGFFRRTTFEIEMNADRDARLLR